MNIGLCCVFNDFNVMTKKKQLFFQHLLFYCIKCLFL